jgi:AcrR family transcriptional regulator
MTTRPQPSSQPVDKREAILDAALVLFAERGFHGTAVPLVAERAGVGAGTLYRYFESKEALVNALYRRWKGQLLGELLRDFPADGSARQQFHAFWTRMVAFARQHPEGFNFLELHHHAPYLDEESRRLERDALTMLRQFIGRAQELEQMKAIAPEVLMAIAWGAFVGLVKAGCQGYVALTDKELKQAENAVWEALRL